MGPRTFKFLADENISPKVVSFLRGKGIDVLDVKEQSWIGADDKFIMARAYAEKRMILTHDSNFGTLAIAEGVLCYGIIYLRLRNLKADHVIGVLDRVLTIGEGIAEGTLVVVDDKRMRIRGIG